VSKLACSVPIHENAEKVFLGCLCEERSDAAISLLHRKGEIASPFGFAKTVSLTGFSAFSFIGDLL
jgi:hypothetical protein